MGRQKRISGAFRARLDLRSGRFLPDERLAAHLEAWQERRGPRLPMNCWSFSSANRRSSSDECDARSRG